MGHTLRMAHIQYSCIECDRQPSICSQILWNRYKWWQTRFAIYLFDYKYAQKFPWDTELLTFQSSVFHKPVSILLTKLLRHIEQGRQKYDEATFSRRGVNQMWILKNSQELLENLKYPNFNYITSLKSVFFRPFIQPLLTRNWKADSLIQNSLIFKNGYHRNKY